MLAAADVDAALGRYEVTVPVGGTSTAEDDRPSTIGSLTAGLTERMEVALPPAIVTGVLSPFVILEALLRALLGSSQALLLPLLLLASATIIMQLRERMRRHPVPAAV